MLNENTIKKGRDIAGLVNRLYVNAKITSNRENLA